MSPPLLRNFRKVSSSQADSMRLAKLFAASLSPGDVILLQAPLAAGKTFFTRFVLQTLGIPSHQFLGSPTFSLIQSYLIDSPFFEGGFHHADLYRLSGQKIDLVSTGLLEIPFHNDIIFIEWPDLYQDLLSQHFPSLSLLQISLDPLSLQRIFTFSPGPLC